MITKESILAAIPLVEAATTAAVERLQQQVPAEWLATACIGHSGGKDSVAVTHLVSQVYTLPVVHTAKPGGDNAIHPATLEFLYMRPFAIEYWPRVLGMNPKYKTQFDGSRAAEANRSDRSADFIRAGVAVNRSQMGFIEQDSMFGMAFIFPMYEWSDDLVWAYILQNNLEYSNEYEYERSVLDSVRAAL